MDDNNLVLIGFMGVGKTTVGELLADRLQREFLDMDRVIEKETGRTIPDIFAAEGEVAFREIEKRITIDYCRNTKKNILSLGGGAYMQPEIREACLKECTVIFLDISWEQWLERMEELKEGRPLLQEKSLEEIQKLFDSRHDTYRHCTHHVLTDRTTPEEVTEIIMEKMS
ncbi:shikimate kinase [Alteribacillus iranensis]|uniref:Shikimate kinase n=1 Tax=Alteribacillus iranensis TaxID=930128 RepID=A0A1I2BM81_9BACI|nr:shikimate kinase [Alteribacillus iranensis]SFE57027.1 shikimate kinase [Alteribacillus iranensis]